MDNNKASIVVFSGELDKALAAFFIATTAAAMGMDVTMFFTFWGLNVIKVNQGGIRSKGLRRRLLNILNRGGSRRLPLSRMHMFGLGTWMMRQLMEEEKMLSLEEMILQAKSLGVKFVACTTTIALMGLGDEAFIPQVDSLAGAATFIGEARESKISLFI